HPVVRVGGDVVHRGAGGGVADDVVVRPVVDRDPVAEVGRDLVAIHLVGGRRGPVDPAAVGVVVRDEVALAGRPAPDQVVGPLAFDAKLVAEVRPRGRVGADVVVLHAVAVAQDVDAAATVGGDDVAVAGCRTADGVKACVGGDDTGGVARGGLAGDVGADEVAGHSVAARVLQVNAPAREVADDQAPHGRTAAGEGEAVPAAAQQAAVQDNLEAGVVEGSGGVDGGSRLGVAVDGHRCADGRQGGLRLDGVGTRRAVVAGVGRGDDEHDFVAGVVGCEDRLAQRARA